MRSDFDKAVKKADLYAHQAIVVTISVNDVSLSQTTTLPDGTVDKAEKSYKAADMSRDFLTYLKDSDIPHAVIMQSENVLTFALPREEDDDAYKGEKAREIIAGFFKDGKQNALSSEAYLQQTDSMEWLKNMILSPFDPERREVNRNIAKFNRR